MQYKTCSKCKQVKDFVQFNKSARSSNGLRSACKSCDAIYRQNYVAGNNIKKIPYSDLNPVIKEQRRAKSREWNKANKDKRALAMSKRRALQKQNGIFLITSKEILKIQKSKCFYCGMPGGELDHVIPLSKGGTHGIGNLVAACRSCNSSKNNLFLAEWKLKRKAG